MLRLMYHPEIRLEDWQQYCQEACQISEWLDNYINRTWDINVHIDRLMQKRRNSSTKEQELHFFFCINLLMLSHKKKNLIGY